MCVYFLPLSYEKKLNLKLLPQLFVNISSDQSLIKYIIRYQSSLTFEVTAFHYHCNTIII